MYQTISPKRLCFCIKQNQLSHTKTNLYIVQDKGKQQKRINNLANNPDAITSFQPSSFQIGICLFLKDDMLMVHLHAK